ncbi:MAG: hypothetical protein ACI8UO_001735 [Verrucomicrobiales bacterium]|jgi:hypothetical protein
MTRAVPDGIEKARRSEALTQLRQGWMLYIMGIAGTALFLILSAVFSAFIVLLPIWMIFEVIAWLLSLRLAVRCLRSSPRSGWVKIGAALLIWIQAIPLAGCCGFGFLSF